ncbi:hypothetical protein EDL98_07275 [Ornithobacterium rhinotracheale]|nr:hypothetical protein [Ornithobacterium rhinotracheale]
MILNFRKESSVFLQKTKTLNSKKSLLKMKGENNVLTLFCSVSGAKIELLLDKLIIIRIYFNIFDKIVSH